MTKKKDNNEKLKLHRRSAVQSMLAASVGGYYAATGTIPAIIGSKALAASPPERLLITFNLAGGASALDSFMAIKKSEITAVTGTDANVINCFDESDTTIEIRAPGGDPSSPLRGVHVKNATVSALGGLVPENLDAGLKFLDAHYQDIMVLPTMATSVNHGVAQLRSVTGNDAWNGRTLQEACAAQHGAKKTIANLITKVTGMGSNGIDPSLPEFARGMKVSDAMFFGLGLSGTLGLQRGAPPSAVKLARALRDKRELATGFHKVFQNAPLLQRWLRQRNEIMLKYEGDELAKRLFFLEADGIPSDPGLKKVREMFSNFDYDPLDAQTILAFLALTNGVSSTVTLGPTQAAVVDPNDSIQGIKNPPIGFDFSHQDHRGTQAMQWSRSFDRLGKLIHLLKETEHPSGGSYWDYTVVHLPTDFGRDWLKPAAPSWSSGHHLENGVCVISPLANGNMVYGGCAIDLNRLSKEGVTALKLHSFDTSTGKADPSAPLFTEKQLYSSVLTLLDVDYSSMTNPADMSFLKKS